MKKGIIYITILVCCCLSQQLAAEILLTPGDSTILHTGCSTDGYSVDVNGITYNESNPTGTETLIGASYSGADSIITINLVFNPNPTIGSIIADDICEGEDLFIFTNADSGTYEWSDGQTGEQITVSGLAAGVYDYELTITDSNGCTVVGGTTAIVYPALTPVIIGNTTLCAGTATVCTDLDAGLFSTYLWSDPAQSTTQTIEACVPGDYTVWVTDANGCGGEATITITESPALTPTITISETSGNVDDDGIICAEDNAVFNAGPYLSYAWSDGSNSQTLTTNYEGTYTVTVTDDFGCQGTAEATLIVNETIYTEEVYMGCPGDGYSTTINGTVYDESNPTGSETFTAFSGCDSIVFITLTFGNITSIEEHNGCAGDGYEITVNGTIYNEANSSGSEVLTSYLGCDSTVYIDLSYYAINPAIVATETSGTMNDDGIICDGDDVVLDAGTFAFYQWSNASTNQTTTVSTSGTYTVTVTNANGCEATAETTISVNPLPAPSITITETSGAVDNDGIICDGDVAVLDAGIFAFYQWSNGSTAQTVSTNSSGTYTVTVSDGNGCEATAEATIISNISSSTTEDYTGQEGDGYEVIVNGNTYNEANPSGVEVLTGQNGCDSTVFVELVYYPETTEFVNYEGCSGDGYSFDANGVIYDENNPSGTETIVGGSYLGTDSVIVVNLVFSAIDVTIQPSATVIGCENQSVDLITNVTNPIGTINYAWSNGELLADINTNIAGTYTVTVSDGTGCTGEAAVTITETISDCVFPGDANYDFVVNSQDHLTVCLAGGDTGPARQTQGITFTAHDADDWNDYVLNGSVDKKHLDCDGDGMIQWADLDAVNDNYNSMHDGTNVLRLDEAPSVRLVFADQYNIDAQNNMITGTIVIDNIDTQEDIEELYGILFSIEYDNTFIEEGSLVITYQDSWLGTDLEVAPLYKNFHDAEQMDLAFTRGDQASVSGSGIIATISFIIEDNLIGYTNDYDIPMNVTNVYAHNHLAEEQGFNGESTDIHISIISANENILSEESITVYPNPTNGKLAIDMKGLNGESLALYNALGQLVLQKNIQGQNTILDLEAMSKGIYFLNVKAEEGMINVKIIID